ncbi:BLUF domain containing protein [Methylophilaceae bacterium]
MKESENNFFQLIYTSVPSQQLNDQGLFDILIDAQKYNQQAGVSGFMLYSPVKIIQLIEGDEANVNKLFQKIQTDPRHHSVSTQHHGFADKRCMPFLGMGLCYMEELAPNAHQFYFTRHEAKNFSALITGDIGHFFKQYLD